MSGSADLNRLRWRCRRGMRELDTVMLHFLDHRFAAAPPAQQQAFAALLEMQDPELFALILGKATSNDQDIAAVVAQLQHTFSS